MYYLNGLTFKSLKIFVIIWVLVVFISPPSTLGNPITKRQFKKVVKLLEESIQTEIPSDDADQYSDVLFQEQYDKKNLTYYHAGDKTLPVFISNGFGNIGANIHVLLRGEDYINPKDQNDFVVLKKVGSPEGAYSVHRAYIVDVQKLSKLSKVIWNDGRVEQQKNIKVLLNQLGNTEVQARSLRAHRPLCDWIGYSLLCNSKMNVPPARERKEPEPLDEEDEEPVNLPGVQDDADNTGGGGGEAGGDFAAEAAKQKRMVGVENDKGANKRKVGNELLESGEEGSEEEKSMLGIKEVKPTTTTTTTTTSTTSTTSTTTPRTRSTTTPRRVIERKQETTTTAAPTTPSDEGEKQEEQSTKKKHKRKHKSKKKNAEINKK